MPTYREIIRLRLRSVFAYRQNVFFMLAIVVMQIFVLRKVWTALYAGADTVNGMSLSAMLVYLTIANLQTWALQDSEVSSYIQNRVREGQIAFDLLRPASFVPQVMAHLVGSSIGMGALAIVMLPFVAFAGTLAAPASAAAFGTWLVSLLLGYAIAMMINLIIGMLSFWTTEVIGLRMLYQLINQFLAGAMVPLTFFPATLASIARLLPFQATTYTPVSIYVGQLTGSAAAKAIGVQVVWVGLLALGVYLLWRVARRRVFVQGG
jgi:ABC-type uncharacterized transport system permease subunit